MNNVIVELGHESNNLNIRSRYKNDICIMYKFDNKRRITRQSYSILYLYIYIYFKLLIVKKYDNYKLQSIKIIKMSVVNVLD